jgi:hypothetical protein
MTGGDADSRAASAPVPVAASPPGDAGVLVPAKPDPSTTRTADAAPPASSFPSGSEDRIVRATKAANQALDASYAEHAKKTPPAEAPAHTGPWVREADAHVAGDVAKGLTITFSRTPPAGFSAQATVTVSASGEVKVRSAVARFASD